MIADIIGNNASLMQSAASPWHCIHFTQRALYIFAPGITKDGTRGDPVDGLKNKGFVGPVHAKFPSNQGVRLAIHPCFSAKSRYSFQSSGVRPCPPWRTW